MKTNLNALSSLFAQADRMQELAERQRKLALDATKNSLALYTPDQIDDLSDSEALELWELYGHLGKTPGALPVKQITEDEIQNGMAFMGQATAVGYTTLDECLDVLDPDGTGEPRSYYDIVNEAQESASQLGVPQQIVDYAMLAIKRVVMKSGFGSVQLA